MKQIKPLYIYLVGLVVLAGIILLFNYENPSVSGSDNSVSAGGNIAGKTMPQDEVHKGLEDPLAQKPSSSNVMSTVIEHMKMLEKDVNEHPGDTLKIREYADFLAEAHQHDKALVYYNKILDKYPRRTDIMSSIVFMEFSRGKFPECEKYLKKILSVDKNNLDAMYNLGVIYANEGNKKNARETWTKIIVNYPSAPMAQKAKDAISHL